MVLTSKDSLVNMLHQHPWANVGGPAPFSLPRQAPEWVLLLV